MKFLASKNIGTKIVKILLLTSIILGNLSITSLAKTDDNADTSKTVKCADLNPPGQGDVPEAIKGKIITILEERINPVKPEDNGKSDSTGTSVINCMRQTKCTFKDKTLTCKPLYVENNACTPADGDTSKDKKGDGAEICQPVQAIIASSGANLLYSYVGIIYKWAAGTVGIVTVLYMVFGGIEIATAGGDDGKLTKAKERIMQSIAGLVLLFLSALILYTINPNFFVK